MHLSYIPQRNIQNRNMQLWVLNGALWHTRQVCCVINEIDQLHPSVGRIRDEVIISIVFVTLIIAHEIARVHSIQLNYPIVFSQSTKVSIPWLVHNLKRIGQLRNKLWSNEASRDLSSKCVSDGYLILHRPLALGSTRSMLYLAEYIVFFWVRFPALTHRY